MSEGYNGVQKAAILLIALGPEKAATIFKHLKEEEIEELTLEIANTRSVSPQTKEELMKAVGDYRKELQNITWEGWIIKSAIIEEIDL